MLSQIDEYILNNPYIFKHWKKRIIIIIIKVMWGKIKGVWLLSQENRKQRDDLIIVL